MNNEAPQPPRQPPLYLKYLMALPQDCTREEFENAWRTEVEPLIANGPAHLWNFHVRQLMTAGLPASKCDRALSHTRFGQSLKNSVEREAKARARAAANPTKPPFAQ